MVPARGVGCGLNTSNSRPLQTTVPTVCPLIQHPATKLPEPNQFATNPLKELELLELWKAKPDLPGISQPEQLTYAIGAIGCSTTARLRRQCPEGVSAVSGPQTIFNNKQLYRRFVLRSTTLQPSCTNPKVSYQPSKAMKLQEQWKAKPDLPGKSQ